LVMAITAVLRPAAMRHWRDRIDDKRLENKTCRLLEAARGNHSRHAAMGVNMP